MSATTSAPANPRKMRLRDIVRRQPAATAGAVVLLVLVVLTLLAPVLTPYEATERVGPAFDPPSGAHPLGLNDAGQDMVTRLLLGTRVSLFVGIAAALVTMVLGVAVGVIAGYGGRRTDTALMRITDYVLVIPLLPLMIVVAANWGSSLTVVILTIGFLSWTIAARLVRAQVKSLRERQFVLRAETLGARRGRIVRTHILPHLTPLLVALTVQSVAIAIFYETALAFLGLGDPTRVSLGQIIQQAFNRAAISVGAWWAIVPPGVLIVVALVACTLLGRAIEDAMNPRLEVSHLSVTGFRVEAAREQGRSDA